MTRKIVCRKHRFDESVIGQRFGKDEIIGASFRLPIGQGEKAQSHWYAVVSTGDVIRVRRLNAMRINNPDTSNSNQAQHKKEFDSWRGMIERCTNPKSKASRHYSEKGITVCDRWRSSFRSFLEDMGPRKENETIERTNNKLGYEPGNCIWATMAVQRRNQGSRIIWFEKDGVRMCLTDWCNKVGTPPTRAHRRVDLGWSVEEAIFGRGA